MFFESSADNTADPPGPSGRPIIGNTRQFMTETPEFYVNMSEEYGDVVSLSLLGLGDVYLLTNPFHVEDVFMDNDRFTQPEAFTQGFESLFGDGIVTSRGDHWRRQRTLMQPAFQRDRMESYEGIMTGHAERLVARWEAGQRVDIEREMRGLTLRVLIEAMFGSDLEYDDERLRTMATYLEEPGKPKNQPITYLVPEWVPIPLWRRYKTAIEYFEGIIYDLIAERRAEPGDRQDLLSMLLAARDDTAVEMSDELLRDEMMAILIAGHETTALTLTCAWYLLATHPEKFRRLRRELDDVLDGRTPTMADLPELEYTESVIRESLRLYPPAPIHPREPTEDVEIGGYDVPAGSFIAISAWALHRDERHYDDPAAFRPERWTNGLERDLPSAAFCPFGGGPRQCLGQHFAMIEAQLLLATIAQTYDLDLASATPLDVAAAFVLIPETDLEMTVRARRDA